MGARVVPVVVVERKVGTTMVVELEVVVVVVVVEELEVKMAIVKMDTINIRNFTMHACMYQNTIIFINPK